MKPVPLLGIALDVAMLCTDVHGISNLSNTISEINNGVLEKKKKQWLNHDGLVFKCNKVIMMYNMVIPAYCFNSCAQEIPISF